MFDIMYDVDGYKCGHRLQWPKGTQRVYSNFTPRASRVEGQTTVIHLMLQHVLQYYLTDQARDTFFEKPKRKVLDDYKYFMDEYMDMPNLVSTEHIGELHDMGYMPLEFCGVPEGMHVPLRMPGFTTENTHDDFSWLTNYFETLESSVMWQPMTSATTAYRYRKIFDKYCEETGGNPDIVPYQGHDFAFRGLPGPEPAARSGVGHLSSFYGTDTLPAIVLARQTYGATGIIGKSVRATEHAVMTAEGRDREFAVIERLIDDHPTGILAIVGDAYNIWRVIGEYLPRLKDKIMARQGKLVLRPDSGIPENILCGDPTASNVKLEGFAEFAHLGVVQSLYNLFGGTTNAKGYKELDSHIGTIYGEAISPGRSILIFERLKAAKFASTNVMMGIGSYTYQYVTRDTYGMAMKATWTLCKNKEVLLFKDPVTDDGLKKSATGRIAIVRDGDKLRMIDGLYRDEHLAMQSENLLKPVWRNGKFLQRYTLEQIRENVRKG